MNGELIVDALILDDLLLDKYEMILDKLEESALDELIYYPPRFNFIKENSIKCSVFKQFLEEIFFNQ